MRLILLAVQLLCGLQLTVTEDLPLPTINGVDGDVSIPFNPSAAPNLELRLLQTESPTYYAPQVLHHYMTALRQFWEKIGIDTIDTLTITDPAYEGRYMHFSAVLGSEQFFDTRQAMWATYVVMHNSQGMYLDDFYWHTHFWLVIIDKREKGTGYVQTNTSPTPSSNDQLTATSGGKDFTNATFPLDLSKQPLPGTTTPPTVATSRHRRHRRQFDTNDLDRPGRSTGTMRITFTPLAPSSDPTFHPQSLLLCMRDTIVHMLRHLSTDLVGDHYQFNARYATACPAPPSPPSALQLQGANVAVIFYPTSFKEGVQPLIKEMVNCAIAILERVGGREAVRDGFRKWEASCLSVGAFVGTLMKVEAWPI